MPVPTTVDSNQTGLSFAEEQSLKVLPVTPIWYAMEPNSYSDFGATFSQVAREVINATRQRLRGSIVDETAKAGINVDLTQRNLTRLLQGFFFADAIEKPATQPFNGTQIVMTAATAAQFQAAAGLGIFLVNHLISVKGFINAANNGLAHITAVAAGALTTDKVLTVEAAPPAAAQLEAVGIQGAAGDLHIAIAGVNVTISSTALDFTTLGLNVGEWVFVGGDAAINNFATAPANNQGYARILSIAAHLLTFDITTFTPLLDADVPATQKVQIFFGKVINNAILATSVKRRSYQLERTLGNDGIGTQSEYLTGAIADQLTFNVPIAAKITTDLTFVGLDNEVRSGATGIKAGTRVGLPGEPAYNSANDIYLSRIAIVDRTVLNPTPLYAYVSDVKLVINNAAVPTKALGVLGGFNVTQGDFVVTGTVTAYFSTIAAIAAVRNNSDCSLQLILSKNNSGMIYDIPLLALGGGLNKVVKDKPIEVAITQDAAKNVAGYTMMAIFFEYLPTVAL
jgi:hypothetical protein